MFSRPGKATKPVLLSFSNPSCTAEQKDLGFPFEFLDIPDACYEMVQVSDLGGLMSLDA